MGRFRGIRAGWSSIIGIFRNLVSFLKIAFLWSALHTGVLLAYCVYVWLRGSQSFDIAGSMWLINQPDQFQLQNALTALPNILGELSVAIWWTRFILDGRLPTRWIDIPSGSARYFGRELLVDFGAIVAIIPSFILAPIISPQYAGPRALAAGTVILINIVVALYFCARLWLVFPAIAMADDRIDFKRSFRATRGAAIGLLMGSAVAYFALLFPALLIDVAQDYFPRAGVLATGIAIGADLLTSLFFLAAFAAAAGVAALAYRQLVPPPGEIA